VAEHKQSQHSVTVRHDTPTQLKSAARLAFL